HNVVASMVKQIGNSIYDSIKLIEAGKAPFGQLETYGLKNNGVGLIDDDALKFADPVAASRAGVGMVHQHFRLVASMTVAENLYLNRQPKRFGLFSDRAAMRRGAADLIAGYGFDLEPDAVVGGLSVGQRQHVEILKAL